MKCIKLIIFSLVLVGTVTAAPVSSDHKRSKEVKIPAYIRRIYHKMSLAMEQDDIHIGLEYLKTVHTVHWLEPIIAHDTITSTEPYKYHYTVTFNTSELLQKEHPNYAELFLHVIISTQQRAQIKVVSNLNQLPVTWQQPARSDKGNKRKNEVLLARIALTSLTNSSLQQDGSTLTVEVASTNAIRMPSKQHHQTAVGLVLYMGGAPEAIDKLLAMPVVHPLMNKKKRYNNSIEKRSTTPCQVKKGLKVKFSDVGGGFEKIIRPDVVDIGRCVGECPQFLHHLHNPSDHAEIRNLLAYRQGSARVDVAKASCVPITFKPLPVVLYNDVTKGVTLGSHDKMVATACGCR